MPKGYGYSKPAIARWKKDNPGKTPPKRRRASSKPGRKTGMLGAKPKRRKSAGRRPLR